ncbi:hypothetical protein CGX12_00175 [Zobellella denitrificans]|uniref:GGDEF domain-containing protein n=1 Tax=Zobellella denitrificans TaxID=347534 RepID=UPI000B8BC0EC|nr:diguanylate cyclase [Zobellella denitrificans]OXS17095.1 hypothetical protein CGX12_00175 [Zobellella denitrificans]
MSGTGLTTKTALFTILLTLLTLSTVLLALLSFSGYRAAVNHLADQQTQALMTASRLVQQSESMVASSALLLLADTHASRRRAVFEITDRSEWIGRLTDALQQYRNHDRHFAELTQARFALAENLQHLDTLVGERINLLGRLEQAPAGDELPALRQLEQRLRQGVEINRRLSRDLSVAVGFHIHDIRNGILNTVAQLNTDIERRERQLLLIAAAALLMVVITVVYIHRTIVHRILALQRAISHERPRPEYVVVQGRDEISDMARSVRNYIEKIGKNEARILNMNQKLHFMANHDALTGLYNRHHFEHHVQALRLRAPDSHLCLAMVDIDFFKSINDRFGHDAGDKVLTQVAATFISVLPPSTLVARFGGEEFAILFTGTSAEQARQALEHLRGQLAGTPLEPHDLRVTLSGGLACDYRPADIGLALKAADTALYQAKHQGRNRIVLASPLHTA